MVQDWMPQAHGQIAEFSRTGLESVGLLYGILPVLAVLFRSS